MMIPSQRHLFDIPEDVAYFNCAYMSPLSHVALAAGDMGLRRKYNPWKCSRLIFSLNPKLHAPSSPV